MNFLEKTDPIVSVSSGTGLNCAISVIRISGFQSLDSLDPFVDIALSKIKPRYAHYFNLVDGLNKVDDVIGIYYPAPNSYTGENLFEFNVHGNALNVENILNLIKKNGFRAAYGGEFTYRALKNSKLSLSQVEGLDLFLNASSAVELASGKSLLNGECYSDFLKLRERFLNHKSSIELNIEFVEDVGEEEARNQFNKTLQEFKDQLLKLGQRFQSNLSSLIEPKIVLFGRPNAGKSTIFNKLLGSDRSIVTETPGTTRDFVSERFYFRNNFYQLIDTAGLRKSSDEIEQLGIKKGEEQIEHAFFKVLVLNPFDENSSELMSYMNQLDVLLFTHNDKEGFEKAVLDVLSRLGPIGASESGPIGPGKGGPIGPEKDGPIGPEKGGPIGPKILRTGLNLQVADDLMDVVHQKYRELSKNRVLLAPRQREVFQELTSKFMNYEEMAKNSDDFAVIDFEAQDIGRCLSELIGILPADSVVHNIFENFCIGK